MLSHLPLEMLEAVLMRTFMMLYSSDHDGDDDRRPYRRGKSNSSERRAFTLLSSVCKFWYNALSGWPESPTGHWVRHQLRTVIERKCTQYRPKPSYNTCRVSPVWDMTSHPVDQTNFSESTS